MENKEVKLSVRNLRISFRTDAGKVQAVRDISFDLYKGETLAIVGESGSGKSVTNRAVIGILAGNAIKEGGEIIYDGQDLMKIKEDRFHRIRGDKIAMIFQDPMSALNPIVRIGKQLTEAMIIKGRKSQRESRREFNSSLKNLNAAMNGVFGEQSRQANKTKCSKFNRFEVKHLALEKAYNEAYEAAEDALSEVEDILLHIERKSYGGMVKEARETLKSALKSFNRYVVYDRADDLKAAVAEAEKCYDVGVKAIAKNVAGKVVSKYKKDTTDYEGLHAALTKIRDILKEALAFEMPNFFAMGYYFTFSGEPLPEMPVSELNEYLHKYLDDNFMLDFIDSIKQALEFSHGSSQERMKAALKVLEENEGTFSSMDDVKAVVKAVNAICKAANKSIDPLEIVKDNFAYIFSDEIKAALEQYYQAIERNAREEKRYARQMAKYERKVKAGKTPDYKVADKNLASLEDLHANILSMISDLKESLARTVSDERTINFESKAVALIDHFKELASGVANKVTRRVAKLRALKLMEEVGIPEPRRRYRQYPFEFSGGMRQRIVIAIALSANPDILICDEPTTALDVTIQAQILELINKVKAQRKLSVIFITHNLGVVANMADRVAVMYAGKIVEIGTAADVFYTPAHPYTWALLSSMPDLDTKEKLDAIPGTPPNMIYPPKGDAFAERNKYALKIDFEEQPPMFEISDTHFAATWLLHPSAPKVEIPRQIQDRIARMKKKMQAEGSTNE